MQSPNSWHPESRHERGQTTIALVAVMVLVCVIGLAISTLADAMVHRARARTAADAAALAIAADPAATAGLIDRYRSLGISIEQDQSSSTARSGPAQAVAWAENTAADDVAAPALVAIIARAEQLTGSTFSQLRWDGVSVELPATQAAQLRLVAADLGLCERSEDSSRAGWNVFELC